MALINASFTNKGQLKEIKNLSLALIELQTKVSGLVTLTTELKADQATLLAKLDADAGVTDTNYAATCATAAAAVTI